MQSIAECLYVVQDTEGTIYSDAATRAIVPLAEARQAVAEMETDSAAEIPETAVKTQVQNALAAEAIWGALAVDQKIYRNGAHHLYATINENGRMVRKHISHDAVLKAYGYDPKDPAYRKELKANQALRPDDNKAQDAAQAAARERLERERAFIRAQLMGRQAYVPVRYEERMRLPDAKTAAVIGLAALTFSWVGYVLADNPKVPDDLGSQRNTTPHSTIANQNNLVTPILPGDTVVKVHKKGNQTPEIKSHGVAIPKTFELAPVSGGQHDSLWSATTRSITVGGKALSAAEIRLPKTQEFIAAEVAQEEQANGITTEAQAEHMPVGFNATVPKQTKRMGKLAQSFAKYIRGYRYHGKH